MSLFQNSVLNKYLKGLETEKVKEAYEKFTRHFHNPEIQENIRNSKEEQYQGEFLIDLFVNVLGYIKNPAPEFNLTTELKNIKDSKKTDGAILNGENALAVIELKGTNTTDLSKVEIQAFGYKNNQPGCNYVITSNFEKLRFYIDNAVDFEEFNLFQLTKERFDILWLCLSADYLLKNTPKRIKDESLTKEENVTKELYNDYSNFRNEIFDSIQKENPEYDKLTLFKKTQKLLDRFLFIFFAEDRLLLPPNSIRAIVNQWKDLRDKYDEYVPLYDRFKKYFGYMNTGHKGQQHDIFAYNGGLFAPDEILDNIKINDEILSKHTVNLSNYDFESEVSVNILGHIFEHSLNEIETIQSEIEGIKTDQSKTKRKKDGVFYTPKYITKYIVENTIGKLCIEKKIELEIQETEFEKDRKGRQKTTLKKLTQKLDDYRKWLLQLTICDPACGSGAFLNQALEFLIAEHRYIDELQAKLFGVPMILSEVENSILENNLYGVDINEESVEIAKLSLWLRTAQKGRKLTTLNNNIKCGNSLIEDPEIAGEKAFNWQKEFPEIFAKSGFDVVIGNPPYVRQELIDKNDKSAFEKKFPTVYRNTADLYVYFYNLSIEILNNSGVLGFITPNKYIRSNYGAGLRQFLSGFQIQQIIDFGELPVFEDAATFPSINIIQKTNKPSNARYLKIESLKFLDLKSALHENSILLNKNAFESDNWILTNQNETKLLDKIRSNGIELGNNYQIKIGIKTGFNEAFVIDESKKNELIQEDSKSEEIIKRFAVGDNLRKYRLEFDNKYLILTKIGIEIESYPAIFNHLNKYRENLEKRWDKGNFWYELRACDYYNEFEQPKIVYPDIAKESRMIYDSDNTYFANTTYFIPTPDKWLTAILNSKLVFYFYKHNSTVIGNADKGGRLRWFTQDVKKIPIPQIENQIKSILEKLTDRIIDLNNNHLGIVGKFQKLLEHHFSLKKFSKKLQGWHELEFKDFLKELQKAKVKLSLSEEAEWMQYFNEQKEKAQALKNEINKTDKEIDKLVYELYGLTEDEIKIVEEATA